MNFITVFHTHQKNIKLFTDTQTIGIHYSKFQTEQYVLCVPKNLNLKLNINL